MSAACPWANDYPQVSLRQYPQAIYPWVTIHNNGGVDKYEFRRRRFIDFVTQFYPGRGGLVRLGKDADIDPSYLRRMRYPTTKAHFKRIGEDTIEKIESVKPEYKDWFSSSLLDHEREDDHESPSDQNEISLSSNSTDDLNHESSSDAVVRPFARLFPSVDLHRYARLSMTARLKIQERMNDEIDLAEARAATQQRGAASWTSSARIYHFPARTRHNP